MKILAIESSCDETAAAVIENTDGKISILSNVVASQISIHAKFGGVFPEVASRAHAEKIIEVIDQAILQSNNSTIDNIDLIAVTAGPGLIGSLLVGVNSAKALAYANQKPIMPINHWLGHIYSCFAGKNFNVISSASEKSRDLSASPRDDNADIPKFPLLALIVSGGHTGLVYMKSHTDIQTIGQTLDDAAGEAFDKVAKILGLGYPGGPAIAKAAEEYTEECHSGKKGLLIRNLDPGSCTTVRSGMTIRFPRSMLDRDDFNFSFSGLKTAVLYKVKELEQDYQLSDFQGQVAHEFQQCVIDILIGKTLYAAKQYQPKSILLCGGVSANKELREQMATAILSFPTGRQQDRESRSPMSVANRLEDDKVTFHVPPMELTGDNAAMIGLAAAYQIAAGVKPVTFDDIDANPNLKL